MTLLQRNRRILAIVTLLLGFEAPALAQDASLMPEGTQATCATALVNDPVLLREAWANTLALHPGIVEAVRRSTLQRTALDFRVGDQERFWVYNLQSKSFDTVRAELKAVGAISYVWVALGEWNNNHVTATEVDAILTALERSTSTSSLDSTKGILQINRLAYGDPPNINTSFQKGRGDGKTHFLICDIQDGWSGTGSYVAGFFFNVDVDPNTGRTDVSNRRDMLYIDSYPGLYFNGRRRTSTALATLSHEFQHLIHWNYDPFEVTFFNEGLSEYAEFLCGFDLRSPLGYFGNPNVALTLWNNVIEDYSRAALWTRFAAEQYGTTFLRNFVQNSNTGIPAFEQALAQSGVTKSFTTTMQNFFLANWLGSSASDPSLRYATPLAGRPKARGDYVDPNIQRIDTLPQLSAHYIRFESARNFRALFSFPSNVSVRAIESGSIGIRIREVASGIEFISPELGSVFTSLVFVAVNTQPVQSTPYTYSVSGELLRFVVEELHDSGTPHPYSAGFSPYLGFGNNGHSRGMAVRFQPTVKGNVLRRARMLVMFNQEFSNGTALPGDHKDFLFHVWGDRDGRPGVDLIPPFLVTVDRTAYPVDTFVDIDLTPHENALGNLTGPVYIGFMEDSDDSVGTYVATDNFTSEDFSYVYRGPTHPVAPNMWQTMREVSALNNNSLDGFNLMMRAVFEYSDSSAAPVLSIGYLQNPLLSEYIDVIAASPEDLRSASLTGTMTQGSVSLPLRFYNVPGTARVFIDTSQQLKSSGPISLKVRGAKKFGVFYTDTTVSLSARLLKVDEPASVSTPSGAVTVSFEPGSVSTPMYVTAFDGPNNPQALFAASNSQPMSFFLGPPDVALNRFSTVRVTDITIDESMTLARQRNGKWYSVQTTPEPGRGALTASVDRLGVFAVMKKADVDGQLDEIPSVFALHQNYPNPFNPSTTIEFDLPVPARARLVVYDVLGKVVERLIDEVRPAGHYRVKFGASGIPSGVYFYRLTAGGFSQVRKLLVLR